MQFILYLGLMLLTVAYIYRRITHSLLTFPHPVSYLKLTATLFNEKLQSMEKRELSKEKIQETFMQFVVDLGKKSLQPNHKGISLFLLPNLSRVYVITKPALIHQIYNNRALQGKYGQTPLFNRLDYILGPNNLMSSKNGTPGHDNLRGAILRRNEDLLHRKNQENRYELEALIEEFFELQSADVNPNKKTLGQVMDALSRRVLLYNYFSKKSIDVFETLYHPSLTQELMGCLFDIEPVSDTEKMQLWSLREKIFNFGCLLLQQGELKEELCATDSWLNRLMTAHVLDKKALEEELLSRGIDPKRPLTERDCSNLIEFAKCQGDTCALSSAVIDALNESLFIPLLGFDATATLLITTLRIMLQDPRILKMVRHELAAADFDHSKLSTWGGEEKLSYTEAVILEALRILPPAPAIPEVVQEPLELKQYGQSITLPQGALLLMPLEAIHQDSSNFPDIYLSEEAEALLGKKVVTAKDIFPERWLPVDHQGNHYNAHLFTDTPQSIHPAQKEKEGSFLSFKTGRRRCPGLRLALGEALSVVKMLTKFDFEIKGEDALNFPFVYKTPLQRQGGKGHLTVRKQQEYKKTGENALVQKPLPKIVRFNNFTDRNINVPEDDLSQQFCKA
ncbi:Cytochrome P450 [Legionella quinlivanii]|uniref:Cytochrome P450 n=1 Tax=Legionella quinlivanii TaxID=45073 RepID=A0A0W0Y5X1_9GAMM|nr:cytochrome P450 [Legionella quinlivanii]KTD52218.1 Cytochrome P450 [Legionella quinlivanii]SEF75389.1 Cytochrome P450 [Legionella quinlivanii DSM 21216]STY12283.1 Cytochrome P450 [Legionella quinlivanii]